MAKPVKSKAAYMAEHNALVVGATASLERAASIRKQMGPWFGGNHSTSKNGLALTAAVKAASAVKTYKGAFERNAR
jgi:hypothetical protein